MNLMKVPAYPTFYEKSTATHPDWHTPLARDEHVQDGIVIYPEIIPDNPLRSRRVVRWLLNRPGYVLGQPMNYSAEDYLSRTAGSSTRRSLFSKFIALFTSCDRCRMKFISFRPRC